MLGARAAALGASFLPGGGGGGEADGEAGEEAVADFSQTVSDDELIVETASPAIGSPLRDWEGPQERLGSSDDE